METLFWSKTEWGTLFVSNSEVRECFFLIPPTKAETYKPEWFTKNFWSDLSNLFLFIFFLFVASQFWAYDFLEKDVQKDFEVNLYAKPMKIVLRGSRDRIRNYPTCEVARNPDFLHNIWVRIEVKKKFWNFEVGQLLFGHLGVLWVSYILRFRGFVQW